MEGVKCGESKTSEAWRCAPGASWRLLAARLEGDVPPWIRRITVDTGNINAKGQTPELGIAPERWETDGKIELHRSDAMLLGS